MSDSENYLDQLLNSVNGGGASAPSGRGPEKPKKPEKAPEPMPEDDDFASAFDEEMSDEDFLAAFERDLGLLDEGEETEETPVSASGKDRRLKKKKEKKEKKSAKRIRKQPLSLMEEIDDSLFSARGENLPEDDAFRDDAFDLTKADQIKGEDISDEDILPDEKVTADEVAFTTEEPKEEETAETEIPLPAAEDSVLDRIGKEAEELPLTEAGEPDLAGVNNDDLLNMLSGTEGMEDIGDLLSKDASGENVSTSDEIGSFADAEMKGEGGVSEAETEALEADGEDSPKKSKKKKKKEKKNKKKSEAGEDGDASEEEKEPGFFAKLFKKLTRDPEEEEEEKLDVSPVEGVGVEELSDENMQLLRQLEDADSQPAPEQKEDEKKAKKKEKKEKPKKEKKAPKPKKPKKEKKPKEPDNSPKLNKKGVAVLFLLVASMLAAVLFLNNAGNYSISINNAKADYRKALYLDAYMEVEGITIHKKDAQFYNQVCTMATVYEQYHNYLVFDHQDMTVRAFDSLVCAAGRYNANLETAAEYECTDEMNQVGLDIQTALSDNYGMTMDDAEAIYSEKTRAKYTLALHQKLQELGLE